MTLPWVASTLKDSIWNACSSPAKHYINHIMNILFP